MTAGSYILYVAPVHPYSLDNFREKFIFVLQFSHPQTKSSFGRLHVLKLHLCNHIGTGYMNVCHESLHSDTFTVRIHMQMRMHVHAMYSTTAAAGMGSFPFT